MYNFWFKLSAKIRFLIIGSFNALFSYLIYSLLCLILGSEYYQLSLALSFALSSVVSFNMQKHFVFQSKGNFLKEYLKCCTSWLISYAINALLLEIFVSVLKINIYLSQFFATGITAVFTYILFKYFAFKEGNNRPE